MAAAIVRRLSSDQRQEWLRALLDAHSVLLVASPRALDRIGLTGHLPRTTTVFSDFVPNPTVEAGLAAARLCAQMSPDLVVGIGGGSAMDVSKSARALPATTEEARAVLDRRARPAPGSARLVLVPTTPGTGSEVTSFATLYRGVRKISLDDERVRADEVGIDPELLRDCPSHVLWCGVLDTISHAVESSWSLAATPESRASAVRALQLLAPVAADPALVDQPDGRDALSRAGTAAGMAIDRTRTTAAHALSYPLTAHLGLDHGYACALNLRWLIPVVAGPPAGWTVVHPGGPVALREAVGTAATALGVDGPEGMTALLSDILARCDRPRPSADGSAVNVDRLVDEGLGSERVAGMPLVLPPDRVRAELTVMLSTLRQDGSEADA